MLEHRRLARGGELPGLRRADFVDRFGEMAHDVEAVEPCTACPARSATTFRSSTCPSRRSTTPRCERGRASRRSRPASRPCGRVRPTADACDGCRSIDQGQVALPAAARELVHADGLDVREVAVREAPVDRHAHGPIDGIPGRGERRGDLLPRQALGPPGAEPVVGVGQSVLAGGPRDGLDLDAAARAGRRGASRRGRPRGRATGARSRSAASAACRSPGPGAGIASTSRGSRRGDARGPPGSARVLDESHGLVDERRVLLQPIQDTICIPFFFPRRLAAATPIVADSGTGCVSVLRNGVVGPRYRLQDWSSSDRSRDGRARSRLQAVSPAQRGRSGATRLDGGEHTRTLWVR